MTLDGRFCQRRQPLATGEVDLACRMLTLACLQVREKLKEMKEEASSLPVQSWLEEWKLCLCVSTFQPAAGSLQNEESGRPGCPELTQESGG